MNCHGHSGFVINFQDSLDGVPEVLFDPNGLSKDGTVSLNRCAVSEDAKYLAYGLSSSGSDWMNIKVMRIKDRMVEPDTLSWVSILCIIINFPNCFKFLGDVVINCKVIPV